ncbi:MAG: hypothetical protein MUC36_17670 [Planctomycetes bacterium]|nr:hypothetical protein [Planctomycetota bacterium]
MSLLRADLRVLGNLVATAAGRRLALGVLFGHALLAAISWLFALQLLGHRPLLVTIHRQSGGDSLHGLLGYGLMACPLVATWLGLALAQRQLFEAPELPLWRTAPIAAFRGPLQALLRAIFLSTTWALALAGPFVMAVLHARAAPGWAYALVPVAVVGATAPLLATLLATQIVLVRFFAGRWLRLCFVVISALASVGFMTWLLLTLFASGPQRMQNAIATAAAPHELPWAVASAARLLTDAAGGTFEPTALLRLLAWLGGSVLAFVAVALLHPRACERHLAAEPPLWRGRGRRWPSAPSAAVRKKEFAQVLQQPGALIGFLVFAVLVFGLCRNQVLVAGLLADARLPRPVQHLAVLLVHWFLAVLLVLYAHMGRLVLWDGPQWSLYMASPVAPQSLLRGKLQAVFVFLCWPLLLVTGFGAWLLGADGSVLLTFVGIGLGGNCTALGVLAVVGTWPRLMQPDQGGQVLQGGRSFLAALLLVAGFELACAPVVIAWWRWHPELLVWRPDPAELGDAALLVVGAAMLYGSITATLGNWIGTANVRRLLRPR